MCFIIWLLYIEVECQLVGVPQPTQPPIRLIWSEQQKNIYPNPRGCSAKCNCDCSNNCFICDVNHVLSKEDVIKINSKLLDMRNIGEECFCRNDTSCVYTGIPIAIAIMNDFEPDNKQGEVMSSFAEVIFSTWQFQTCTDGIIYVIGKKSNPVVFRRYGKTLSSRFISDSCKMFVNESSAKLYKEGRIVEGILMDLEIYSNIVKYGDVVCGVSILSDSDGDGDDGIIIGDNDGDSGIIIGIVLSVIVLIILIIILVYYFGRKCRNRGI